MTPTTDPEGAFVGALLHLPAAAAVDAMALVDEDDLADPRLIVIVGAARQLAGLGIPPDPAAVLALTRASGTVTGAEAVRGLSLLLADLFGGCPVPASVTVYASAVLDDAVRRRCVELSTRIGQAAVSASLDVLAELVETEARAVRVLDDRRATVATGSRPTQLRAVGA